MNKGVSFGDTLKAHRKRLDLTQAELARHIGCSTVTVAHFEQDRRRPSKQMALLLAGQTLRYLKTLVAVSCQST